MNNQLWKRIYFTHIIFKITVSSSLKIICYILMIFSYINKRFLLCYSFWGFYFTILKNVKNKIFVYICRWFEMLLAHGKWWNIDLLFWKTFSVFLLMIWNILLFFFIGSYSNLSDIPIFHLVMTKVKMPKTREPMGSWDHLKYAKLFALLF